jgi:hypothetical protein
MDRKTETQRETKREIGGGGGRKWCESLWLPEHVFKGSGAHPHH